MTWIEQPDGSWMYGPVTVRESPNAGYFPSWHTYIGDKIVCRIGGYWTAKEAMTQATRIKAVRAALGLPPLCKKIPPPDPEMVKACLQQAKAGEVSTIDEILAELPPIPTISNDPHPMPIAEREAVAMKTILTKAHELRDLLNTLLGKEPK